MAQIGLEEGPMAEPPGRRPPPRAAAQADLVKDVGEIVANLADESHLATLDAEYARHCKEEADNCGAAPTPAGKWALQYLGRMLGEK